MTVDLRINALQDLIGLRKPIGVAIKELRSFPWDSDAPLVTLAGRDLIRILDGYLQGDLSAGEIEDWADAVEGRDDIGYEPGREETLRQAVFELANPLLTVPLSADRARTWKDAISGS